MFALERYRKMLRRSGKRKAFAKSTLSAGAPVVWFRVCAGSVSDRYTHEIVDLILDSVCISDLIVVRNEIFAGINVVDMSKFLSSRLN